MDTLSHEHSAAEAERVDSSSVLVSEGPLTPMPQPSFSAAGRSPPAVPRSIFGLLIHALRHLTEQEDLTFDKLSSPCYEGSLTYLRLIIEDGSLAAHAPDIPVARYSELHRVVTAQLQTYQRILAAGATPSPGGAPPRASDGAGAPRIDRQWAYNGTHCARLGPGKVSILFWLDHLLFALQGEYGIHDGQQQGLYLRQLVEGPVLTQLTRKIAELPELRRAAEQGAATFDDYAAALIACSDPDDALACHYAASHPSRHSGEKLSDAVARADLAFRAAAAHHCQPAAAGCFWAVYGLLTPPERSTYTGRPGVRGQLQRPLHETKAAADLRYQALLDDLLAWAKVQSTTSAANPPRAAEPSSTSTAARADTPRRRRRGSIATAAAARAGGEGHRGAKKVNRCKPV